jgi:hypothetical protein
VGRETQREQGIHAEREREREREKRKTHTHRERHRDTHTEREREREREREKDTGKHGVVWCPRAGRLYTSKWGMGAEERFGMLRFLVLIRATIRLCV